MIRINQLKIPVNLDSKDYILKRISEQLGISKNAVCKVAPVRRSIDARKKPDLFYIYNIDVTVSTDEAVLVRRLASPNIVLSPAKPSLFIPKCIGAASPVVCGMGPAGLFCALVLAKAGLKPILIERGKQVDARTTDCQAFMQTRVLNPESNIQFGEGGAGTFSDGKLNTGLSNERLRFILETFVRCGAPETILYDAKPHIGTDILRTVIKTIRNEILAHGGSVCFETKLKKLITNGNMLQAIQVQQAHNDKEIQCDRLVLAIGHSARDTFEMLYKSGIKLEQKPFSMGVRIEHKQHAVNLAQYGTDALGAADYKLSYKTKSGRGVYTFCMCPGGHVVAATSEAGSVVTNGMSFHARNGENANAALLCDVRPADFGSTHPLAGVYMQRKYEQLAFVCGGSTYNAPATLVGDFLENNASTAQGSVTPTYKPAVTMGNIAYCLPPFVCDSLREALPVFGRKLKGFDAPDAVLTAIESRSSSPVRIVRDASLQANIQGLYPCGEGAGYAGGIMSAASDGIRVALAILEEIKSDF